MYFHKSKIFFDLCQICFLYPANLLPQTNCLMSDYMNEPWKHYAKWNKSVTERKVLPWVHLMWGFSNRFKESKNDQKFSIKQNESVLLYNIVPVVNIIYCKQKYLRVGFMLSVLTTKKIFLKKQTKFLYKPLIISNTYFSNYKILMLFLEKYRKV